MFDFSYDGTEQMVSFNCEQSTLEHMTDLVKTLTDAYMIAGNFFFFSQFLFHLN